MREIKLPIFKSDNDMLNSAFRIAFSDLISNVYPYKAGLLKDEEDVILAGTDYPTPWTRDASINTWNCAGLLMSDVAKHTLLSVLKTVNGKVMTDGEYWDAIIWATGAWWEYLYTDDKEFLNLALDAVVNSLEFFEKTEFDEKKNLFRGAACYGDGIAAYPDDYIGSGSGIMDFVEAHPERLEKTGVGIPMYVLSTNCLYYNAYKIVGKMKQALGICGDNCYELKASRLKDAINMHFWMEDKGCYRYIIDDIGNCNAQEGIGLSFAVLFGIADKRQIDEIFKNVKITPQGIPCVWPSFARYDLPDGTGFGRHSGTIWPHIEAFFADVACRNGEIDIFENELKLMAARAVRDGNFAEIYHPYSGHIYGGRQERREGEISEWKAVLKQTWSATGFLRLIIMDLFGMDFTAEGLYFNPTPVLEMTEFSIYNIEYRHTILNIFVKGAGRSVDKVIINGEEHSGVFMPDKKVKEYNILILMQ